MSSLADIRLFLLDMDGTVYLGSRLLPGSLDFLRYLRETSRDHLFLTNNSSRNANYYAEKLTRLGWPAKPEEVLTSGEATALYLGGLKPSARVYLLGTPDLKVSLLTHRQTIDFLPRLFQCTLRNTSPQLPQMIIL